MKDKLKTLKHQINERIKELEKSKPKLNTGELKALEWVLKRIKENAK